MHNALTLSEVYWYFKGGVSTNTPWYITTLEGLFMQPSIATTGKLPKNYIQRHVYSRKYYVIQYFHDKEGPTLHVCCKQYHIHVHVHVYSKMAVSNVYMLLVFT